MPFAPDAPLKERLEEQLAEAQALAHIGSWEWDLLTNRVSWSEEHYRIFGLEPGSAIDYDTASRCVHPADRSRVQQQIRQSLTDGNPYVCEFRIHLPDGSERIVEARGRVERDASGRIGRKVGTSQDITERATTSARLQRVETQYRTLVEHAVEGIFRTTQDGRFLMANASLARMLGYETPEQLIAERADLERDHYVRPEERSRFKELLDTQGIVRGFEYEAYRRDGTTIWLRDHARIVRDPGGGVYYEGTVEDVTIRRRAEGACQHLLARAISAQEEERARIARELHDDTAQALSAILLGLKNLEQAGTVEQAHTLAHRLRDLTAQTVRGVGRLARGLRPSTLDDLGLLPALQRYGEELGASHELAVRITGDGNARFPANVETTLYRIVQEALTNVARHAQAQSADVTIQCTSASVQVTVRDDGAGFDVSSALEAGGTRRALGLMGMHERASLLGGSLVISSRPGEGTSVTIELPLEAEV